MTSPIDIATFRTDYPEFASASTYTDAVVQYWLNFAYSMLSATRWGKQLDIAAELYVAHNLALEARAQREAANGAIPGSSVAVLSNKSVDKVSAGYDVGSSTEAKGGHWNLTIYGTRLYRMMKMFGAGPITIGGGFAPPLSGLAWPGPDTAPGFTNFGS